MKDNTPEYQELHVNSATYLTLFTKKFANRKPWQKSDPKEIRSFIPGSIIDVNVKPGQKIKAGETVLTLDSMKMFTKVEMPFDGAIKEIHVSKGDRIPKDTLMITIE
jgi:biotin carboxyl carrier protein